MTKSEQKEVNLIMAYHAAGLGVDYVARALSALIRCASTNKSVQALQQVAASIPGVVSHPEFVI